MEHPIVQWAASRGYETAWTEAAAVGDVIAEIEMRRRAGEIDAAFAHEDALFHADRSVRPDPWKILVVVMPRPAHVVRFRLAGRVIEALLPPTYERYRPTFEAVRQDLAASVLHGAAVETAPVPLKLLAARLGLVRYGRNNLVYSPAAGSYLQLLGYLTDAVLPADIHRGLQAPEMLDECAGCRVCQALCPTTAISEDRVLLHADRCLTLASETAGPWPSWVPEASHDCLIGCLACQRLCPANGELRAVDSGVSFSEDETAALLEDGEPDERVWAGVRRNLEALGQPYQEAVIGRNLKALLRARTMAAQRARV